MSSDDRADMQYDPPDASGRPAFRTLEASGNGTQPRAAPPATCPICQAPSRASFGYCPVCSKFCLNQAEGRARAASLKRARRDDGFHCEYSGALLNISDPSDPLYLNFDHKVPGVLNDLLVTGAVMNDSKAGLTWLEYPLVVSEFVRHLDTGEPFDRDVVPYAAWGRGKQIVRATNARLVDQALMPRFLDANLRYPAVNERPCRICERYAVPATKKYCPRCEPIVERGNGETRPVKVAALKKAYDWDLDAFMCRWTCSAGRARSIWSTTTWCPGRKGTSSCRRRWRTR
jgi:hypothetical protein